VTILFANLHAYLDNLKAPWELLQYRVEYYEEVIKAMLEAIDVPLDKLRFKRGTEYQLSREYTLDVYKLSSLVTLHDAQKAGAEVVKQTDSPCLSGLLYPGLQALDEEYLECDAQFGGVDQRKIFMFARKYLPHLDYPERIHLMNPMVPGLTGNKMSSSEASSKIDILDDAKSVKTKINKAFCEEGNIEHNGVLSFAKMVLFPLLRGKPFVIERPEKYGGNVSFDTFEEMERAFADRQLYPVDLKGGVATQLNNLLEPIREKFKRPELVELTAKAYPEENHAKAAPAKAEPKSKATKVAPAAAKAKAPVAKAVPAASSGGYNVSHLKIVVGTITKAWPHPDSDKLWCEEIDVGEAAPRQIASGLRQYYADASNLENRKVLVLANLKPRKLGGFPSNGMVLCAGDEASTIFAEVPKDTPNGERVHFPGFEGDAATPAQMDKKKIFDAVKDQLIVENGICTFGGVAFTTSCGVCTAPGMDGKFVK